jgi:hypothetical protein
LEIAVFYVPLPTIENVEICWKRRKIGHYRAVQFSEREAVSISPKQSVVGSTPTGLNPQTSNSFWLMLSRACWQTCEEHRLERFFLFIDSFSNFQAPIVQFHAAFAEKMCYNTNASRKSYSLFGKKRRAAFTISNSCPTK